MTAKVDPHDTAPMTVHFLGNLLTFHIRSATTGDKFTLIENRTAPGQGAPVHRQADDEAFYVLEVNTSSYSTVSGTRREPARRFISHPARCMLSETPAKPMRGC